MRHILVLLISFCQQFTFGVVFILFELFECLWAERAACQRELLRFAHPCRHTLAHTLLKGQAEGAIAAITTLVSQLLGRDRPLISDSLAIETDEMADAQVVDVGIVIRSLIGEILAEVKTVGTYGFGQLLQGEVVLQEELLFNTMLLQ